MDKVLAASEPSVYSRIPRPFAHQPTWSLKRLYSIPARSISLYALIQNPVLPSHGESKVQLTCHTLTSMID